MLVPPGRVCLHGSGAQCDQSPASLYDRVISECPSRLPGRFSSTVPHLEAVCRLRLLERICKDPFPPALQLQHPASVPPQFIRAWPKRSVWNHLPFLATSISGVFIKCTVPSNHRFYPWNNPHLSMLEFAPSPSFFFNQQCFFLIWGQAFQPDRNMILRICCFSVQFPPLKANTIIHDLDSLVFFK